MGQALRWLLDNLHDGPVDNVVVFKRPDADQTDTGADLVHQAASLISAAEDVAREAVHRARLLLEREAQITQQFNEWVASAETSLDRVRSHLAAVDMQLFDAESRASAAEQRSVAFEEGLARIEDAIQKKLSMDVEAAARQSLTQILA